MDPFTLAILSTILGGIATAAIISLAQRSPRVMAWFKRYFLGLKLLIVGPKRSGKTSFYNFLKHDYFADQRGTNKTKEVIEIKSFDVNKGGELNLPIKKALDIPGQLNTLDQADLMRQETPQAIIIFTAVDNANPSCSQWLRSFLIDLRDVLDKNVSVSSNLVSLTIVLNKIDLVSEQESDRLISEMQNIVDDTLRPLIQNNVRLIDVIPCTLYKKAGGERTANTIVLSVVEAVRKNQRLVHR